MHKLIMALFALTLSACVQVNTEVENAGSQLAISSIHDHDIVLDENSTYAFTPLQESERGATFPLVTAEIEKYLAVKGFQQVTPEQNPTFYIGYILEREEDLSDEQLSETFGLNPGLPDLPNLDKGTMLMFALEGESKQFAWRAAAQGFIIEDISAEERHLKIQQLVNSMLHQFVNK